MIYPVSCAWCNDHQFMVDRQTLDEFRFIVFTCPKCGKQTTVGTNRETPLLVLPGTPKQATKESSKPDSA
jgi:hypothetical protein